MTLRAIFTQLNQFVLPHVCLLCQGKTTLALDICLGCYRELPWHQVGCKVCASALPAGQNICGQCLTTPPRFQKTLTAFDYEQPVSNLISAFKFHKNEVAGKILSQLMLRKLRHHYRTENKPQLILPIPLHKKRQQQRGYNQALEIARLLSQSLQIPLDYESCERLKATEPQSSLSAKQRQKNIKNAFSENIARKVSHVAVVDDVVTTGNTVREFCRQLPAELQIDVWCLARTR